MLRALDKSLCGFLLQIEAAVARAVFISDLQRQNRRREHSVFWDVLVPCACGPWLYCRSGDITAVGGLAQDTSSPKTQFLLFSRLFFGRCPPFHAAHDIKC